MLRRIGFGVLWAIAIYSVLAVVVSAVAGGIAGAQDPQNATVAGARAGVAAVNAGRLYIVLAGVVLSAVGTWLAILPGTWKAKADPTPPDPPS